MNPGFEPRTIWPQHLILVRSRDGTSSVPDAQRVTYISLQVFVCVIFTLYFLILFFRDHFILVLISFSVFRPRRLTFTWWGCCGLCQDINQPNLPTPFYSVLVPISVFYSPFNCISFYKFFRQLSAFSLSSSGLHSVLLVLSTVYLFMKVSLSPDIFLSG